MPNTALSARPLRYLGKRVCTVSIGDRVVGAVTVWLCVSALFVTGISVGITNPSEHDLLLQRQHLARWAALANGGNVCNVRDSGSVAFLTQHELLCSELDIVQSANCPPKSIVGMRTWCPTEWGCSVPTGRKVMYCQLLCIRHVKHLVVNQFNDSDENGVRLSRFKSPTCV